MPNPGDKFPKGDDWISREFKKLWRAINDNASARSLASSSIGSGGLTVKDGGSITVEPGGNITLQNGTFAAGVVNATTNITAGQDVTATRDVTAGQDVTATRDVTAGRNVNASGSVTGASLNTGGAANVAGVVKSPGSRAFQMTSGYAGAWLNGDGTLGISTSSERYKENIKPLSADQLQTLVASLLQAVVVSYDRIGTGAHEIGFIAERFVDIGLEAFVFYNDQGQVEGINYDRVTIALAAAVQQQQTQLTDLVARIEKLENPTA